MSKIEKEKRIIGIMINNYCKRNHYSESICDCCKSLLNYAEERLDHCPFKEEKTSCKECKVHCYSKEKRKEIRKVMSDVGPRMIYIMPIEYFKHILGKA